MNILPAFLYEKCLQNYPYFEEIQYSAVKTVAPYNTLNIWRELQKWERNPENQEKVQEIKEKNKDKMKELLDTFNLNFEKFRKEAKLKIPSVESFTKPTRMYPEV